MVNIVKEGFLAIYGNAPELVVKAPGRINLIGEHTDYNGGLVLPAAIDRCMYFAFRINESNQGRIHAKDLQESITIDLYSLQKTDTTWVNYLTGILLEFEKKGFVLKGFDCFFTSDIPIGAGMSSSSALECGFALAMNNILEANLDKWQIIEMSHQSNHTFMNIYGGILDQFSSLFGQAGKCMMMNCADRSFDYHDIDLGEYTIAMINTNVQHEHTSSGYNDRASECKEIVKLLQDYDSNIRSISESSLKMISKVGYYWPDNLKKRAKFIIDENDRVRQFIEVMKRGDVKSMGTLLYRSHKGLQELYEVSCPELDVLVDITKDIPEVAGARMMGGGFGGCTINIIKSDSVEAVIEDILGAYKSRTGIQGESYFVKISDGARVIV